MPTKPRLSRCLLGAALIALVCAPARAVTVYDLGAETPVVLPDVIDATNSPVYFTNASTPEGGEDGGGEGEGGEGEAGGAAALAAATGELGSLRVGQYAELHIGYDNAAVAADDIAITILGDMTVNGVVMLGKDATSDLLHLPNPATTTAVSIAVSRALNVGDGGHVILNGASDGGGGGGGDGGGEGEGGEGGDAGAGESAGENKHAVITADSVLLDGGALTLQEFSQLVTGLALSGPAPGAGAPSVVVRNGGALTINSGVPAIIAPAPEPEPEPDPEPDPGADPGADPDPAPPEEGADPETRVLAAPRAIVAREWQNSDGSAWTFKGVDVRGGGGGILVDNGGVLSAGNSGGAVMGVAGQTLTVAKGGLLDAGRGDILVGGIDAIVIAGSYRAGANSRLTADSGTITFTRDGSLSMSRELQRQINSGSVLLADTALLRAAGDIVFENGLPPQLASGMGFYGLETKTDADGYTYVGVNSVVNGIVGNRSESDRQRFRDNMGLVWQGGTMNRDQADNLYNLAAVETPSIQAYGASGELNRAVLEAIVDGRGQAVPGHGRADQGVFEMYAGGAGWGVNNVAYNVAGEFMAGLDRRVERIGAEMDRLGEGWGGEVVYEGGYPSLFAPDADAFERRFWVGGFGRDEEAELDYGITGYTYRPRGVMLGYDKVAGAFSLGAAAAYGTGDYRDMAAESGDSAITSYSAGVYATYHAMNGLHATAHAAVSHLDNELRDVRGGMRREASHTGYSWSAGARVGYDKPVSDKLTLSPSIGISKIQAVSRAHDEYLDGVGVLRVGEATRDSTLVPLDVTLGYDLLRSSSSILRLTGNLGYAYDFEDGGLDGSFAYDGLAGASSMGVARREAGHHRFNAGAGLIFTGPRLDIGARYDFVKREKQTSHQARGSIGVKF